MSDWVEDRYDKELFSVLKEIVFCERIGEHVCINTKYGMSGTDVLLKKLDKFGIIKITDEINYGSSDWEFLPNGLLKWVVKDYLKEIVKESTTKKELDVVKVFFKTLFFKKYFFQKIYFSIEKFENLEELKSIINDLLCDGREVKKKITDKEYYLWLKASKIARKRTSYSHQRAIQFEIESYFTMSKGEKDFMEEMNKIMIGVDMVGADFLFDLLKEKGYTKNDFKKTAEALEEKGLIFKPRFDYYKPTGDKIEKWLR